MSLADRRRLRLFTLCALYVAQGIPWGFTATTIPAYLGDRGLGAQAVGTALAMTTLPYAFKWVWGPIIDAFTIAALGRRRTWILFAQGMMALTIISLITIPDLTRDLEMLAWMILIHTVFNSLQDVAVDALAIDLLDEAERGRANGFMYASKYGGGVIGGAGMSEVIARWDLDTALIAQTVILLAIMLVPLLVRERPGKPAPRPKLGVVLRSLGEAFSIRSTLIAAVLMLGINFASGVLTANAFVLYTQQLEWSQVQYTRLSGGLGLVAGFGGSIIGGYLADLVGRRRLAAIASIAMAGGWVAFAILEPWWSVDAFAYGIAILETLCQSIMTVSLFALCMDLALPRVAATQFTAYMALLNFSSTMGYRMAGPATEIWDFQGIYIAAAAVQIAVTGLLLFVDPTQTRRELPRAAGTPIPKLGIAAAIGLLVVLGGLTVYVVNSILA